MTIDVKAIRARWQHIGSLTWRDAESPAALREQTYALMADSKGDVLALCDRVEELERERDRAVEAAAGKLNDGLARHAALRAAESERDTFAAHVAMLREALGRCFADNSLMEGEYSRVMFVTEADVAKWISERDERTVDETEARYAALLAGEPRDCAPVMFAAITKRDARVRAEARKVALEEAATYGKGIIPVNDQYDDGVRAVVRRIRALGDKP